MPLQNDLTLWLYAARRDKTEVELFTSVLGRKQTPIRITDLSPLQLPTVIKNKIDQEYENRKLLWELWLEDASSFEDLRTKLKLRGYSGVPTNSTLLFNAYQITINNNFLPQTKSMLRKG